MSEKQDVVLSQIYDADFLNNLVIGIGEVSDITKIPQRKLRYWEDKNIIHSIAGSKAGSRRYSFLTIKKILLIKEFLDEGYTLDAASKKVGTRMKVLEAALESLIDKKEKKDELKNQK